MEFYKEKVKVAFNSKTNEPEHDVEREFYRTPSGEEVVKAGKIVQPYMSGHVDEGIRRIHSQEYDAWVKTGYPDQRVDSEGKPAPEAKEGDLVISQTHTPTRQFNVDHALFGKDEPDENGDE